MFQVDLNRAQRIQVREKKSFVLKEKVGLLVMLEYYYRYEII